MTDTDPFSPFEDRQVKLKSIDAWNTPQKYYYDDPLLKITRDVYLQTYDEKLIHAHRFILTNNNRFFRKLIAEKLYTESILKCDFTEKNLLDAVRLIYGDTIMIPFKDLIELVDCTAYYGIDFVAVQKVVNEDDTSYDVFERLYTETRDIEPCLSEENILYERLI